MTMLRYTGMADRREFSGEDFARHGIQLPAPIIFDKNVGEGMAEVPEEVAKILLEQDKESWAEVTADDLPSVDVPPADLLPVGSPQEHPAQGPPQPGPNDSEPMPHGMVGVPADAQSLASAAGAARSAESPPAGTTAPAGTSAPLGGSGAAGGASGPSTGNGPAGQGSSTGGGSQ